MQDKIEQLAWWVVTLILVAAIAVGIIVYNQNKKLKTQQQEFHNDNVTSQNIIIANQDRLDVDLRNSVKCLFALNPSTSTAGSAQACFNEVIK